MACFAWLARIIFVLAFCTYGFVQFENYVLILIAMLVGHAFLGMSTSC